MKRLGLFSCPCCEVSLILRHLWPDVVSLRVIRHELNGVADVHQQTATTLKLQRRAHLLIVEPDHHGLNRVTVQLVLHTELVGQRTRELVDVYRTRALFDALLDRKSVV